jgi:hypothetical protein
MANGLPNIIVMVMSGVLIGALLQISGRLTGEDLRQREDRMGSESRWEYWKRMVNKTSEQGVTTMRTAPTSYKLTLGALYGLVGILVIVMVLSPLRMIWWIFLPSMLLAFFVTEKLFQLAKVGRFPIDQHK